MSSHPPRAGAASLARRRMLRLGCAHCLALGGLGRALAQTAPAVGEPGWLPPGRFTRPDIASDEGGLWALMEREEVRLRRSPLRIRDDSLQAFLTTLACKMGGEHCTDVRVYVLRAPHFNASMAPNGMLQVWSGLLLRMENEAQLASVIGHEIGHYLQRHTLERLRDTRARNGFAQFVGLFGLVGLVGQLALIASGFGFSRDHEREADRIALALMRSRGYDTRQAGLVWGHLLAEVRATPGNDPATQSVLFATHPPSSEREANLSQLASADAAGSLGDETWRRIIAPLRPMLLEDELKRAHPHETIALVNRLLGNEPQDGWLLYTRGEATRQRGDAGDVVQALADFDAAAGIPNAPAVTHRGRGDALLALGRKAEAKAAWQTYLDRAPEAPDAALVRQQLETT
jgi:predicted Zn-dependent protease